MIVRANINGAVLGARRWTNGPYGLVYRLRPRFDLTQKAEKGKPKMAVLQLHIDDCGKAKKVVWVFQPFASPAVCY